jgi:hypothetical protein
MSWYRAVAIAFLLHLIVLVFFTFTFKGNAAMYKIDLVFWGSILGTRDVSSVQKILSPGSVDIKDVDVAVGTRTQLLLWSRGISIDKPDFFKNDVVVMREDAFRFVGQRVELDEQVPGSRDPENDMPQQPAPVKMRLERP